MSKLTEKGEVKFKRGRGYQFEDVDEYLDQISREMTDMREVKQKLYLENSQLRKDNAELMTILKKGKENFDKLKTMYLDIRNASLSESYKIANHADVAKNIADKIIAETAEKATKIIEDIQKKNHEVTQFIDTATNAAAEILVDAICDARETNELVNKQVYDTKSLHDALFKDEEPLESPEVRNSELHMGNQKKEQFILQQAPDLEKESKKTINISSIIDFNVPTKSSSE